MVKAIVKGIFFSERAWLTALGLVVAFLAKKGIALPDGFANDATNLIMVLVASLGIRPPRPKTADAKLEEAVTKESNKLEEAVIKERARRISLTPPVTDDKPASTDLEKP